MKKGNIPPNVIHYPNPNFFNKQQKSQILKNFSQTPDSQTLRINFKPRFIVKQTKGKNNRCQSLHLDQDLSSKFTNQCHSKYDNSHQNSYFPGDSIKPQKNFDPVNIKISEKNRVREFQNDQAYIQSIPCSYKIKNNKNCRNLSTDRSSFIPDFKENTDRFTIYQNSNIGGYSQNASRVNQCGQIRNVSSATYDLNAHVNIQRNMKNIGQLEEVQSDSDKENHSYRFVPNKMKNNKSQNGIKTKQNRYHDVNSQQRSAKSKQRSIINDKKQQYWKKQYFCLQKHMKYRQGKFQKIVDLSGKVIQQLIFLQDRLYKQNQTGSIPEGNRIGSYISSRLNELMGVYKMFKVQKIDQSQN